MSPGRLPRWHRELLAGAWTYPHKRAAIAGRPATRTAGQAAGVRFAGENPTPGHRRIHGDLVNLGCALSPATGWTILTRAAWTRRSGPTWRPFRAAQASSVPAGDFVHLDTVPLRRLCVVFAIQVGTRTVHLPGLTGHPTGAWVSQQARNLIANLEQTRSSFQFPIRDRDATFRRSVDDAFPAAGIRILPTPPPAPPGTASAERWIGTLRRECLDRPLILSQRHLVAVLIDYLDHYTGHRPSPRPPPDSTAAATSAPAAPLTTDHPTGPTAHRCSAG